MRRDRASRLDSTSSCCLRRRRWARESKRCRCDATIDAGDRRRSCESARAACPSCSRFARRVVRVATVSKRKGVRPQAGGQTPEDEKSNAQPDADLQRVATELTRRAIAPHPAVARRDRHWPLLLPAIDLHPRRERGALRQKPDLLTWVLLRKDRRQARDR